MDKNVMVSFRFKGPMEKRLRDRSVLEREREREREKVNECGKRDCV